MRLIEDGPHCSVCASLSSICGPATTQTNLQIASLIPRHHKNDETGWKNVIDSRFINTTDPQGNLNTHSKPLETTSITAQYRYWPMLATDISDTDIFADISDRYLAVFYINFYSSLV